MEDVGGWGGQGQYSQRCGIEIGGSVGTFSTETRWAGVGERPVCIPLVTSVAACPSGLVGVDHGRDLRRWWR